MDLLKKPVTIGVLIALLVTSLLYTGLKFARKSDQLERPSSVKVEVDKVRRGSISRSLTVVGNLVANQTVLLKAQVRGLISRVHVKGGEEVEKGDLLFEIDDRSYKAQVKEAKALVTATEADFERNKTLKAKNFGASKKYEEAEAQMLKAQAQLEKAQKDLDDTKIIAPFEGTVSLHKISEGAPVAPDVELATITDVDPMKIDFKVPAKYIPYISRGQQIKIEIPTYPDQEFKGEIEGIDAQVDPGAQSIGVKGTVDNKKRLLKPGMFVRVNLTVGSRENSLIVPEECVVTAGDQFFVWKVIEHPERPGIYVAFRVPVLMGIQEKDRVEISKGLSENDIIITVGYLKIADGVAVRFDLASIGLGPEKEETKKTEPKEEEKPKEEVKKEEKKEEKKAPQTETKPSPSILNQMTGKLKGLFSRPETPKGAQ
jgi:membrane fusion protein (multidrug efflux system)